MPFVSLTSETRPKRSFFSGFGNRTLRALISPLNINSPTFLAAAKITSFCNFSSGREYEKKQASMPSVSLVSETRPKRSFFSAPENKFANFVEKCRFLIIFNANSAKYFTYNDLDFVFS